ncbi:hypothetical protein K3162_10150 [Qipengyuania xiapuensis]|uniref:Uncharacterized protein n=1 Tax=Qipengyuania xiapuensis TaxID=2867236 RepID=A0ABX8ZSB3_9SPHN|nr:hypothetical protein [Qipengyuania xiapuensis]QZD91911.1 hypothetical protein K3162_10150 [Qipengyuania xiapuensis]
MKYTPHILGAVALVTIGGALSGAAIGDMRMIERSHTDTLPEAQMVRAGNSALQSGERPPDHYALETPEGTIEVGELALHGRMRNSTDGMWWEGRRERPVELSARYDDFYSEADAARLAREEALLAFTGSRAEYQVRREEEAARAVATEALAQARSQPAMTRAEAPMTLAEPAEIATPAPSAREPRRGNAKTIDVSAALAGQN